jgi:hypothetical protein
MVRQGNTGNNGSRQGSSSDRKRTAGSNGPSGGKSRGKTGGKSVSAVYRRRRLFVGIVLLMVLAMGIGGFSAISATLNADKVQVSSTEGGNAGTTTQPTNAPEASASAASPTPATPTCDRSLVTVSASTDKPAYGAGEEPLLSLKVTNGGKLPCDVNIGTSQMEFLVTSGSDRIFSSVDCQASSEDLIKTIAPGGSETANFPWPRNRSVPGCTAVSAKPGAGGAYYVFTAKLGEKTSPKAVFQLG